MHSPEYLPSPRLLEYASRILTERLLPSYSILRNLEISQINSASTKFDLETLIPDLSQARLIVIPKTYHVWSLFVDTKLNVQDEEIVEFRAALDQAINSFAKLRAKDPPDSLRYIAVVDVYSHISNNEPWWRIHIRYSDALPWAPSIFSVPNKS